LSTARIIPNAGTPEYGIVGKIANIAKNGKNGTVGTICTDGKNVTTSQKFCRGKTFINRGFEWP